MRTGTDRHIDRQTDRQEERGRVSCFVLLWPQALPELLKGPELTSTLTLASLLWGSPELSLEGAFPSNTNDCPTWLPHDPPPLPPLLPDPNPKPTSRLGPGASVVLAWGSPSACQLSLGLGASRPAWPSFVPSGGPSQALATSSAAAGPAGGRAGGRVLRGPQERFCKLLGWVPGREREWGSGERPERSQKPEEAGKEGVRLGKRGESELPA